MKNTKIAFLPLILLLTSCATTTKQTDVSADDLLVTDSFSLISPERISTVEIKKDTSVLLYALTNAYGGRKFVPQATFQNALNELAHLPNSIDSSEETRIFCEKLGEILFTIPDNHLAARIHGDDCNTTHDTLFTGGNVGHNVQATKTRNWNIQFRMVNGKRIPIISITSFPSRDDTQWNGFLEAVAKIKRTASAIIIDLRENGGGDDPMGRTMASYLYGQDFPEPLEFTVKSQTPATFAIAANNTYLKIMRLKRKGKPVPRYLEDRFKGYMARFHEAKQGAIPLELRSPGEKGFPFSPKKAFTGPIYILIDRGCHSSCESTLEAFEAHPYVTTVGENTGGFIHFGNMGQVILPHSQINVQMATDYWQYRGGRFLEKIGYAPKVKVPTGANALDAALKELSKPPGNGGH